MEITSTHLKASVKIHTVYEIPTNATDVSRYLALIFLVSCPLGQFLDSGKRKTSLRHPKISKLVTVVSFDFALVYSCPSPYDSVLEIRETC